MLILAMLCLLIWLIFALFRNAFKTGYYEATLKANKIDDAVKDMPFYKIWRN